MAEQLPAARGLAGVDGGELAGQADRARGHRGTGVGAPRHAPLETLGALAGTGIGGNAVGEARGEAAEGGHPRLTGVAADELLGADTQVLGGAGQVLAVVDYVDGDLAWRGLTSRSGGESGQHVHCALGIARGGELQ